MKFLLLLACIICTNAFAVEICSYEGTWDLSAAFKEQGVEMIKFSIDHKNFTSIEKRLIHDAVTIQRQQEGRETPDLEQALLEFDGYYQGKKEESSGQILYYNEHGQQLVFVKYWPGDNEHITIYSLNTNGSFKYIAMADDGYIDCSK